MLDGEEVEPRAQEEEQRLEQHRFAERDEFFLVPDDHEQAEQHAGGDEAQNHDLRAVKAHPVEQLAKNAHGRVHDCLQDGKQYPDRSAVVVNHDSPLRTRR